MGVQTKKLRKLLDKSDAAVCLGVWDAFSARVAEQEGFKAVAIMG